MVLFFNSYKTLEQNWAPILLECFVRISGFSCDFCSIASTSKTLKKQKSQFPPPCALPHPPPPRDDYATIWPMLPTRHAGKVPAITLSIASTIASARYILINATGEDVACGR
jgi:hypothetical protein